MIIQIAIDPGISNGGIAWNNKDNIIHAIKIPVSKLNKKKNKQKYEHDQRQLLIDVFKKLINDYGKENIFVWMENVGFHQIGNNASASVSFGKHVAYLEMLMHVLGIKFKKIAPQIWLKKFPNLTKGSKPKEKQARKNEIKVMMQERYPNIKVTLALADALGILSWARDTHIVSSKRTRSK